MRDELLSGDGALRVVDVLELVVDLLCCDGFKIGFFQWIFDGGCCSEIMFLLMILKKDGKIGVVFSFFPLVGDVDGLWGGGDGE